jgi:hypothetical protein
MGLEEFDSLRRMFGSGTVVKAFGITGRLRAPALRGMVFLRLATRGEAGEVSKRR